MTPSATFDKLFLLASTNAVSPFGLTRLQSAPPKTRILQASACPSLAASIKGV
eukprot:Gb_08327 [translate_table: standard]